MSHILSFDRPLGRHQSYRVALNWRVILPLAFNIAAWVGLMTFILKVMAH